ncbi:MbeD/MobD family mobilization/exclusion protein [Paracoccus sp. (in: a-proteobacteria)]|uniref:MbeD/MobD family mobilization/exclusion protein n=1 Tax=Paracoccus sp. TaxID=267 RepID=UPI002AFED79A|nr:MbeD/MobD family mobilization/exclusion protein [Paracoccus sp. (in: a-proteobacteria)]
MAHPQLTPFETELLSAVEELNRTFETGLKSTTASPMEFANLRREFDRLAAELEARLDGLQRQQEELLKLSRQF